MNRNWIRTLMGIGMIGVMVAPASAQRVRVGFDARLSNRAAASVSFGSRYGTRVAVRVGGSGIRFATRDGIRTRRAWERHQREFLALSREHERLHRRLQRLPPPARARAHAAWLNRAAQRHGHVHPEWEHRNRAGRQDRPRRNLRPVVR